MDLELKHGFRSSFNFVPEGEYRVSDDLRRSIGQAGFEVGVHGLEHDGKLYNSKAGFAAKAAQIREYAERWGACGFRSPLMQHKLAWLHQLDLEYDASTFDTDPFEPQSDGAGTVFPFWVPDSTGGGYVELPYSLAQDFSLFIVLRETTIDIWKKKLDWIAERGGMVLLNTHPDYMCFDGATRSSDEFPIALYEELLTYVRNKYQDSFWSALPRDVARFYTSQQTVETRNTKKKICMIAYTGYEGDGRVRRYAETLAKRGDQVDVIALSTNGTSLGQEDFSGVTLHRIQSRDTNERNKWTYVWRLLRFFTASSMLLTRLHRSAQYDLIHIHNVPDFLVFTAWLPKLTGATLVLDIHDIVPELFISKFETGANSLYVKLLKLIEKASVAFVDHVIVSNDLWYETLIGRSVKRNKCSVFVNNIDPALFYRRPKTRTDNNIVLLFPGTFQWHQGLDIAIEALAHLRKKVPHAELHLYGGGDMEASLAELAQRLGLNGQVKFCGGVSIDRIAQVIANADIGIVPKRADSFGNEAYSTKIMEFMSQGVPVVVSRTKIDNFYFDDSEVRFFTSGDSCAMADAIYEILESKMLRDQLIANGLAYARRNDWNSKRSEYLSLVDSLTTETFDIEPQTQIRSVQ